MIRTLLRPSSLLLACVLASGCGPAPEPEPMPTPESTAAQPLRWPKWIRVIGADIVGAVEGAQTGGAIGAVFGPEGAVIGTVAGAVIYGTQASVEAASATTTTQGVSAGSRASSDPSNALNPFDHIGRHHNVELDNSVSIIGPGGCIPNPFPFPFPRDRTQGPLWDYAAKALNTPQEFLALPEFKEGWYDSLDFVASTANEDIETSIKKRVESGKMTAAVGQRLTRYFTTVAPLDTDKLIAATKSFEKETLADKTLTEQDRSTLLSGYSVARYSAAYWADQAARTTASPWCGCSK
ncbi:hypothetical protein D187_003675 [Cystobacter fuscus DSM 2262]|uniref:Lipoprotein n=1 Tax=Cystobacter fuscus (strain ATCC 25194 / DSM 2262 / NBRC 100088 / M29) TaxID=1242864 RepID=S9QBM7_CYSF2|nr:hypothetical protein [Cystobacter fuscus]EPX58714.1 hypothetical protein D187_003675 [Cystobacter fuscus DSM 2262]